jgi:predicted Rossmann-fold nucleotide-binding protein
MQNRRHRRGEIESAAALQTKIDAREDLNQQVVQAVDLAGVTGLDAAQLEGSLWLGCAFADEAQRELVRGRGGTVFPDFDALPYDPYRPGLYSVEELMQGYDDGGYTGTLDFKIYTHAHRERHHPGGIALREALPERIHDHAIDDALAELLEDQRESFPGGVVGIMGGHGTARSDPDFRRVVELTWRLSRAGYLVVTGGGPGVMEAGNLGAWLAGHDDEAVIDRAIAMLTPADTMSGGEAEGTPAYLEAIRRYLRSSREVVEALGQDPKRPPGFNLAVPTWFYGHEPSNLFSSAVAKYFDNSIREEGLLAIARAGVVYAPGAAGTMQEIFQDLTQNHYATYGTRSPMVLFGRERYAAEHRLITEFAAARGKAEVYGDMVALIDEPEEVLRFIQSHPPRKAPTHRPLYELV